jgi:hypothetical protein
LVLGLIAGFCSACLGIGGGLIVVPALALLFGYDIKRAVGTSLATIVPSSFVGVLAHYIIKSGNIKFGIALFILMGAIIGTRFGVELVNKIASGVLTKLFSVLLLLVGLKLVNIINLPTQSISGNPFFPALIILGLFAGSGSALFGIGGGIIVVPVLNLFFALSMHEAVATSLAVIFPTSIAGSIFHKRFNNIDTNAIKFLIPASLIGAIFGAVVANSLPSNTLKIIFGAFMILCSAKLFLKKQQKQ